MTRRSHLRDCAQCFRERETDTQNIKLKMSRLQEQKGSFLTGIYCTRRVRLESNTGVQMTHLSTSF